MRCAIRHILSAHVIEMVTALQIFPILFKTTILAKTNPLGYGIKLAQCLSLQFVTFPCRNIASLVNTGNRIRNRKLVYRLKLRHSLRRCGELYSFLLAEHRKCLHELEDTGAGRKKRTECIHAHQQVHHLLLFRKRRYPVDILVGGQRILIPFRIVEVHRDIICKFIVGKK